MFLELETGAATMPGSARVSPAGDGVLAIANFHCAHIAEKDCFGETPKPARETRALPGVSAAARFRIAAGTLD